MSNQVSITDLLTAIGSENITFQDVMNSMENIKSKQGVAVISFATDAISPADVILGTGPKGLVLWVDRALMQQRLDELKAGNGLTYSKLLEQHNELLALLERWARDSDAYPADENLDTDTLVAIAKAKGGAA